MSRSLLSKISAKERKDLVIAWIVLSVSFGIVFLRNSTNFDPIHIIAVMIISLMTVGLGFAAHEMAHKFTAMGYGFFAEFRKDNTMLVLCFVLASLVGVIFAAPGATVAYASSMYGVSRVQSGKISAAGPVVNLFLCIPFAIISVIGMFVIEPMFGYGHYLTTLGLMGFYINAFFAAFNMIPLGPLDGAKVLAWDKKWYAIITCIAVVCVIISFAVGLPM